VESVAQPGSTQKTHALLMLPN